MSCRKPPLWLLALCLLGTFGCASSNNHRQPEEFKDHLIQCGVPIESWGPLDPEPLRATSAVAITLNGKDIGVYKYNQDAKVQRERLKQIKASGCVYFGRGGLKHQAFIHGSFVVVGAEKNLDKWKILKALDTFN